MKKDFVYGVSTSAFQIEGDDGAQGRGLSVWDTFCGRKDVIFENQTGDKGVDHYNRWQEDINLMGEMGANAYRFSTSWSRILPDGIGKINQKGVDFYDKLIDEMLQKGIQPFLTLYHWDLPQALHDKGGLQNPDFSDWFAEYADLIVKKYGDRVSDFTTFNEPINAINSAYFKGVFAPGLRLNEEQAMHVTHNMLLAHGKGSRILHNVKGAQVGIAMSTFEQYPLKNTPENIEAARKAFFSREIPTESLDVYLDPIYFGKYPDRIYEKFPVFATQKYMDDMKTICGVTDIIGYNNYSGYAVDEKGELVKLSPNAVYTPMGNVIDEKGLYWGIKFLQERYKKPVYILENGRAVDDFVSLDGKVHDPARIDCIARHLKMTKKLIDEGADIRGYFVWSFMDNFEWLFGYSKRFGLVYVDFETMQRIPKDSYYWYADYIKNNLCNR